MYYIKPSRLVFVLLKTKSSFSYQSLDSRKMSKATSSPTFELFAVYQLISDQRWKKKSIFQFEHQDKSLDISFFFVVAKNKKRIFRYRIKILHFTTIVFWTFKCFELYIIFESMFMEELLCNQAFWQQQQNTKKKREEVKTNCNIALNVNK